MTKRKEREGAGVGRTASGQGGKQELLRAVRIIHLSAEGCSRVERNCRLLPGDTVYEST